jgi:hypothetical protein
MVKMLENTSDMLELTKGYRLKVKIETRRHYDEKGLHLDLYLNLFNDNKYNINRFQYLNVGKLLWHVFSGKA